MCKSAWFGLWKLPREKCQFNQRGACFMGVSVEVTGPGVGTTLKKTKLVTHSISLVNVLQSEYNSFFFFFFFIHQTIRINFNQKG